MIYWIIWDQINPAFGVWGSHNQLKFKILFRFQITLYCCAIPVRILPPPLIAYFLLNFFKKWHYLLDQFWSHFWNPHVKSFQNMWSVLLGASISQDYTRENSGPYGTPCRAVSIDSTSKVPYNLMWIICVQSNKKLFYRPLKNWRTDNHWQ